MLQMFKRVTPEQLLARQREDAQKCYLHHLVVSETHKMLADAYLQRVNRLDEMAKSGVFADLTDPLEVANGVKK